MKAVVALDLGGVLVDVDHAVACRKLGITRAELEVAFFDEGLHDDVTVGVIDGEAFVAAAAKRIGRAERDVREAWAGVVEVWPEGRRLVEDLQTRGIAVHLWSNTDPIHLEKMSAQLPAGPLLATASFHLGAQKPDPAYYGRAARLGQPAIFLDDRDDNVSAAQRGGVQARRCDGPEEARAILIELGLL
jgi:FMN phosphatase YigB (HAD superfamily)